MGNSPLLGLAFFESSSVKINSDRSISSEYSYTCITEGSNTYVFGPWQQNDGKNLKITKNIIYLRPELLR